MNYREFQHFVNISKKEICRETFVENRKSIRVKKEETVVKNLEKIFDATLKISNKKGFKAMTMRDLSKESRLSMGALYTYFSSKEELLEMLQRQGRTLARRILEEHIEAETHPLHKLRRAIQTHLYLSEIMQPWFYFSYMETKHLNGAERQKAVSSELYTEQLFTDLLKKGEEEGIFRPQDHRMTASLIKGKPVKEALAILKATPRKAAGMLEKTLNSAIANAMIKEGSGELDAESLFVTNAVIDGGPVMPRWRPRAYGRASRIRKRLSHIKVTVSTEMPAELKGTRAARRLQSPAPAKKKKKKK